MTVITAPVLATPLPPAPSTNDPDNFDNLADARLAAEGPFGDQLNAMALNVYANASEAYTRSLAAQQAAADAASSAAAAAATTNAVKWVAGTMYADGAAAWSPTSRFSYRHIGASVSNTDPALDPSTWVLQLYTLGLGGMVITGSVDLLSTSGGGISVTPATPGLYITLPDATTVTQGAASFHAYNAGVYDMGVKNKAGTVLGWIRPGAAAVIGLASSAAAAGVWVTSNLQKLGVTAQFNVASVQGSTLKRITIDANRTMFLFGACYAVVYDASSQLWGSPLLVRSIPNGGMASGILVATDRVLVATCDATTGIQSVVLSLTGIAIAPGTPVTSTAGSNVAGWGDFIAVGSGFAWSYIGASGSYVRAATVSGTSPVIGAEVTLSTDATLPILFVSGSVLRAVGWSSTPSGVATCQPYQLSGAALTPGTPATVFSSAPTGGAFRCFQNGNGNLVVFVVQSTITYVAIFKLTSMTESASLSGPIGSLVFNNFDYLQISSTKTAVAGWSNSGQSLMWNIHTDTGGISSMGTRDIFSQSSTAYVSAVGVTGTNARFVMYSPTDTFAPMQFQFDCSGVSPVRGSSQVRSGINTPGQNLAGRDPRHFSLLSAGSNQYAIGGQHALDGSFNAANIQAMPSLGENYIAGALGAAANESWLVTGYSANQFPLGTTIKRIEAAS